MIESEVKIIDLGKLRVSFRGLWGADTVYEFNDAVRFGTSSYIYIGMVPSGGVQPSDAMPWALMAAGSDQAVSKAGDAVSGHLTLNGGLAVDSPASFTESVTLGGEELNGGGSQYSNLYSKLNDLGDVSGDIAIDISHGSDVRIRPIGPTSVSFIGFPPPGRVAYWAVEVDSPGASEVLFHGITWDGGQAPYIQSGAKQTILSFRSRNGGAKVLGAASFGDIV